MNNWFLNDTPHLSLEDFPKNCFGFVYIIKHIETGKSYVGKKFLFHNVRKKIGKKAKLLIVGKGRKPLSEVIHKESDWKTYWGSSKEFVEYVKEQGEDKFERRILHYAFNKRQLTYLEIKSQFELGVLENEDYFNTNIGGRYFRKDLIV